MYEELVQTLAVKARNSSENRTGELKDGEKTGADRYGEKK